MIFINREKELTFLEERWKENKPQFVVLWGKRRVGKTEIVKQFIQNKPHIYFLAETTNDTDQLRRFSSIIGDFFKESFLKTRGFGNWIEPFQYIKAREERFILAIDEFPYLIQANPAIPSIFQKIWDEFLCKTNIFLLILGSSIGMMETEVLGYKAPLYGRRTGQWRIDPFKFYEASHFRPRKLFEDQISHFAIAGGIPAYWLQLSDEKDIWANIAHHVLKKGQMLYDEVEFLLREEFREPRHYFAILKAIAQGKRKLSEVVNEVGLSQPAVNKYLSVLSDLKVIEREIPITEAKPLKSKKGLYRIVEPFFQFWFRFVFPRRAELEFGMIDRVLKDIKREFPHYLSIIYEQVARDILWANRNKIFPFLAIGKWWERNEEIDVVALNEEEKTILFGEVKWSGKPVGINIYLGLEEKAKKVNWRKNDRREFLCLFSKSGYTQKLMDLAKKKGVFLFRLDEMINP